MIDCEKIKKNMNKVLLLMQMEENMMDSRKITKQKAKVFLLMQMEENMIDCRKKANLLNEKIFKVNIII